MVEVAVLDAGSNPVAVDGADHDLEAADVSET